MNDMPPVSPCFLPRYARENVPRYTSYPPATKFHDGVGDPDWANWLETLPKSPSVSLYVHIPFCRAMCWYCGCNTTIPNKDSRIDRYLEALHLEIDRKAATSPVAGNVQNIHFGGGSPDMLSPERFAALMGRLRDQFNISSTAQISVELDPRGLTPALAESMARCGVNRASLGVQDLSDEVQRLIHRIQPQQTVSAAVHNLRVAGINAINMDIMYGLPAQTVERVRHTARRVAELQPDRLAVFGYAHVPWFKKHQKAIPEDRLPDSEQRFAQMQAASSVLTSSGYQPVGMDHFAQHSDGLSAAVRAGTLRRNFQGYTDDNYDALIGLGASAISDTKRGFAQNIVDPSRYADAILAGESAIARGVQRTEQDIRIGQLIETLMCQFELPLESVFQMKLGRVANRDMFELWNDGLVEIDEGMLSVTELGRPYVRSIATRLDPAFAAKESLHSQAV
jgi:oxygen-independent coproporphyrinogen-3 oxidase